MNYYAHTQTCPECGRAREVLHIGKSSMGWCFSLCVHPEDEIHGLDDWKLLWNEPDTKIVDEDGGSVSPEKMLDTITKRHGVERGKCPSFYDSWEDFYKQNSAIPGPNNLLRHDGRSCLRHGEGTWDVIIGEFS